LQIFVDNKITDNAINSLSKLQKLQTLQIRTYYPISEMPLITDLGLIHVINNCPQINSIVFNNKSNITHKTIDALIALALLKPFIRFKHDFSIDFVLNTNDFPNNLVINKKSKARPRA
jgi:hypothetical protein